MRLLVSINIWDEFEDMKLMSEILKLENKNKKIFQILDIIASSGFSKKPSKKDLKYIDKFNKVDSSKIKNYSLVKEFGEKYERHFRIIENYYNIYKYAIEKNYDFIISTNADAWMLNLNKLKELLLRDDVKSSAISLRVGKIIGTDISAFNYVPFFDDHYVIMNVNKCKELNVFKNLPKIFYNPTFIEYGGFHYQFQMFWEEIIPTGFLNYYTDMHNCLNHYGDASGMTTIPFQYDLEFDFMHSNSSKLEKLHYLRAQIIKNLGYYKYPYCSIYCLKYETKNSKYKIVRGIPFLKDTFLGFIKKNIYNLIYLIKYLLFLNSRGFKKIKFKIKYSLPGEKSLNYFHKSKKINHYNISTRV